MRIRLIGVLLALSLANPVFAQSAQREPPRGSSMDRVVQLLGEPQERLPAVGDPPITRWRYGSFTVYFEYDKVLHTVHR